MQVKITTREITKLTPIVTCATATPNDSKEISWANSSDRKWLTNHLHWAMNNNHLVLIQPTQPI
jgi:hypothetical protein